jgi:hypothetical protein
MRNAATLMMAVLTFQLALHMLVLRECVAQRQPTSLVQMNLFMPFCHGRRSVNIRLSDASLTLQLRALKTEKTNKNQKGEQVGLSLISTQANAMTSVTSIGSQRTARATYLTQASLHLQAPSRVPLSPKTPASDLFFAIAVVPYFGPTSHIISSYKTIATTASDFCSAEVGRKDDSSARVAIPLFFNRLLSAFRHLEGVEEVHA